MSINRQFGKSVAWMAAGGWIEQALNFSIFVLLARLLGTEAFGLMAMAAAFVIFAEFLVRESLSEFLISSDAPESGHFNAAFWSLFVLGGLVIIILIVVAGPIAGFYGQEVVKNLIWGLSVNVLLIALTAVPVAILRRSLSFRLLSLRAIAGVVAGGVVAIWMALNGYGVWALIGQRFALNVTEIFLAWRAVAWRPGRQASRQQLREVLEFGSKVLGLRAAELTHTQVPTVIIGYTLGPAVLGLFSISWRLVEIASFLIVTPLRMVSQPAFAAMTRDGQDAAILLKNILRLSGMIAIPAFVGLSVLAVPTLTLLFSDEWAPAAPIFSVLALIGAYLTIEKVHQSYCLAAGRAGAIMLVAWGETVLAAVLIWSVSGLGATAMTAGFVLSFLLVWFIRFRIVATLARTSVAALTTIHLAPLIGAVLMGGIVFYVESKVQDFSAATQIVAGASSGFLFYGIWTFAFMRDRIRFVYSFMAPKTKTRDNLA